MSARVSDEEKLRKARIRNHRWYHAHKNEIRAKVCARSAKYYQTNKYRIKLTPASKEAQVTMAKGLACKKSGQDEGLRY